MEKYKFCYLDTVTVDRETEIEKTGGGELTGCNRVIITLVLGQSSNNFKEEKEGKLNL